MANAIRGVHKSLGPDVLNTGQRGCSWRALRACPAGAVRPSSGIPRTGEAGSVPQQQAVWAHTEAILNLLSGAFF